jgi:hypothetical protein
MGGLMIGKQTAERKVIEAIIAPCRWMIWVTATTVVQAQMKRTHTHSKDTRLMIKP